MTSLLAGAISLSPRGRLGSSWLYKCWQPDLLLGQLSSRSLGTAQDTSSMNEQRFCHLRSHPWAVVPQLVTKPFGTEARPYRSASKSWGDGWRLPSQDTAQQLCQRSHAQGQPQREGKDMAVSDFWWFCKDLTQEQSVKWLEASSRPSLVVKGYLHLSTAQTKAQTGSNNRSLAKLPVLKISTKWVLKTNWGQKEALKARKATKSSLFLSIIIRPAMIWSNSLTIGTKLHIALIQPLLQITAAQVQRHRHCLPFSSPLDLKTVFPEPLWSLMTQRHWRILICRF